MSNDKVKVVGYAQRVFYDNGIEYRNFSDDILGNQIPSDGSYSLFTSGGFDISVNSPERVTKIYKTNDFGDFITLNTLNVGENILSIVDDVKQAKLNFDKSNLGNYAYFGSMREFFRVSLENIITKWPASLYVSPSNQYQTGNTVSNYSYDPVNNCVTFDVNTSYINNKFGIKYTKDALTSDSFTDGIDNRNLTVNYGDYSILYGGAEYNLIGFTGSTTLQGDYITLKVVGNPFNNGYGVTFHLKPNSTKCEEFFRTLPEFEKYLLNRQTKPIYTARFSYSVKTDNGVVIETQKDITWPSSDGYNIDFDTTNYTAFAIELLDLADASDSTTSDIINRFLVSNSISEYDTASETLDETDRKMTKVLRVYGRSFDDVKRYVDSISLANVVTYGKQDNTPDILLKNIARLLGWDITSSLSDNDVINSYLTPSNATYSGESIGLTPFEAENELLRRLILNSSWIWKSKGSRKALEFFFKFIGTPQGLVDFKEYVYKADKPINMGDFLRLLETNTGSRSLSASSVDNDGYPKALPTNYFQSNGLWRRETAGINSDNDINNGNNPHIGAYDGGYKYLSQFENLIPNFSGGTLIDEVVTTGETNLFYNYNNGLINGSASSTAAAECSLVVDWGATLSSTIDGAINNLCDDIVCPEGYVLDDESIKCVKVISVNPISNVDREVLTITQELGYNALGMVIYEDITNKSFPIRAVGDTFIDNTGGTLNIVASVSNILWGNGSLNGRMNNIGVN